ncbi:hypothetical protein EG329_011013 [Mollisiaceae sp. DMI_Dod_QoI]|nr:hypothetical protein EG329_011013 [Helotiales sp. DMI_Dod_QoI]
MLSTTQPDDIPSPPEFKFTPSDVRLKITYNGSPAYAHVSSHAMSLASEVWRNFLFPPWDTNAIQFNEHKNKDKYRGARNVGNEDSLAGLQKPVEELDFTEDNAEALLVVLCAAHLKYTDIPRARAIPRNLLVELAIFCNKYVCTSIVEPWIEGWVTKQWEGWNNIIPVEKDHRYEEVVEECQAMMFVTFVFRDELVSDYFKKGAEWLYIWSRNNSLPDLPANWLMPSDIMENIDEARVEAIGSIIPLLYEHLEFLEVFSAQGFIHWLTRHNLYPRPTLESTVALRDIDNFSSMMLQLASWQPDGTNRQLVLDLIERVSQIKPQIWDNLWKKICLATRRKSRICTDSSRLEKLMATWKEGPQKGALNPLLREVHGRRPFRFLDFP